MHGGTTWICVALGQCGNGFSGTAGAMPVAIVEDVMHLAKGLLRRVLERLPVLMQP